jgi:hypothetical protein
MEDFLQIFGSVLRDQVLLNTKEYLNMDLSDFIWTVLVLMPTPHKLCPHNTLVRRKLWLPKGVRRPVVTTSMHSLTFRNRQGRDCERLSYAQIGQDRMDQKKHRNT